MKLAFCYHCGLESLMRAVADDTKLPCYKVRAAQNSKLRVASHLTFVSQVKTNWGPILNNMG